MRPFQEFRGWLEDAPGGSRVMAAVAGLLLAALVGWLLVPEGDDAAGSSVAVAPVGESATSDSSVPGTVAGESGNDAAPPSGPAATGDAGSNVSDGGPLATAATGGSTCPSGGDQGVTASEIKVAVLVVDLAGPAANNAFNLPSADDQKAMYQAVADAINAGGGAACRKLALQFFNINPADESQKQEQCLDVASAKPFAAIDAGGYGGSNSIACIPSKEIPFFGYSLIAADQARLFPYEFALTNGDLTNRNGVLGLGQLGAFDPAKGFKKLGFIYRSCFPGLIDTMRQAQRKAGIPDDRISEYDVGCSSAFATPADLQQAVLKFRREGVTHMMTGEFLADFANFTRIAQQQGFKPQWTLTDDQIPVSTEGALAPDADNLDGGILVTSSRYGEEHTAGFQPSAGTQKCNAIFEAKGMPPVYRQMTGFGGRACSQLWMVQAAIGRAPRLQRNALVEGLRAASSVEFSFPYGPNDFTGDRVTYGGQWWRPLQFSKSCRCWRVSDPNFRPGFR